MSQNITDANTFDTPASCPADGDAVNGATWLAAAQKFANRTFFLLKRLIGGEAGDFMAIPLPAVKTAATGWTHTTVDTSTRAAWNNSDTAAANGIWFDVPRLKSGKIVGVRARVDGNGGAAPHSALPATKPRLRLFRQDYTTNSGGNVPNPTVVADVSDTPADLAAYELPHSFQQTGLTETIAANYRYVVRVDGETGANAVNNALDLYEVEVLIDPS